MLKPPFSIIQKRKHDEYVDYIEKSMLTKETEADTSLIVKDSDNFYGKLSIFGGQRQEKREGYNKFNAYDVDFINGINTNQEIIKSENNIAIPFLATWSRRKCTINNLKNNTTYKISCTKNGDEGIASGLWDGSNYTSTGFSTNSSAKLYIDVSTDENGTLTFFFYCNYSATNHGNKTVEFDEIMVTEGTEEKPYEPYGVMPSLSYPSEIEGVGDNIQLLQNSNQKVSSFGLTAEMQQDESVKILGKSTASSQVYLTNIKKINVADIEDEDYIFGFRNALVLNHIGIRLRKNNNGVLTEIDNFKLDTINKTRTLNLKSLIDTSTTEIQLDLILYSTEKYDMTLHIKCEKGSKATSYSEYGQGSVEISTSNKNMYDKDKFGQGSWNANETTRVIAWLRKVEVGQKIVIKKYNSKYSYLLGITTMNYRNSANVLRYNDGWRTTEKSEMTVNQGGYLFMQIKKNDNSNIAPAELLADDFQIEFDEATEYIEHRGETLLMPIQQKMYDGDTFERIDDVWYEKHNKVKRIFDGTEDWNFNYNSAIFMLNVDNILTLSSAETSKLSNFIQSNAYSNKIYDAMYLEQTNGIEALNNRINIRESSCSTVEEFKAMLAQRYAENKAIYAVCRLKEPILIKCTDEQCKILDKIDTYKNGTIITTDNDLCKIQLRYKQDLDKRISEIEKQIVGGN